MEEEKKEVETTEVKTEEVTTESSSTEDTTDYKAIAEAEKARADAAEEARLAAEALIVKNKAIAKRQENKEGEQQPLTEDKVAEIVKNVLASTKAEDDSPEAKALEEANKKLAETKAKLAEVARAQQSSEQKRSDSATTHFDGSKVTAPKIAENSPLKDFKYEGNGIYSQKLSSGKTMFKNTNAGPGQPKTWIA